MTSDSSQYKICIEQSTIISDLTTEQETFLFSLYYRTHTLCQFTTLYIYVSIISNWPKQCINKCIDKNLTKSV